jgi:hypothetical protein
MMKRACSHNINQKHKLKKPYGTPKYRQNNNIKKDLTEVGCEGMDMAMNFWLYKRLGIS